MKLVLGIALIIFGSFWFAVLVAVGVSAGMKNFYENLKKGNENDSSK